MPSTLGPFPASTICARLAAGNLIHATTLQINTLLNAFINVKDYGAVGDGVTDDTVAILAAYAAATALGGATIYFPPGRYILGAFTIVPANTTLLGAGMGASIIEHADGLTGVGHLFQAGGKNVTLKNFTIDGNQANNVGFLFTEVTPAGQEDMSIIGVEFLDWRNKAIGGGGVNTLVRGSRFIGNGADSIISGVADNTIWAIWGATAENSMWIVECLIKDTALGGIFCGGKTILLSNHIEGTHRQTTPTGGGQVSDGAEGTVIADDNYIGPGGGPATSGFELNHSSLIGINEIDGQGNIGLVLQAVSGFGHLVDGLVIKNGGSGGSGGLREGVRVNAGVTDFELLNMKITDDQDTPTQQKAINILSGASDRYTISNVSMTNQVMSNLTDGGTGTDKIIVNNRGHNPIPSTAITVTGSPFSWTNLTGAPVTAFVLGGTVSDITLDGSTIATATPKDAAVPHNGTLVVTYSSAPTMKYIGF